MMFFSPFFFSRPITIRNAKRRSCPSTTTRHRKQDGVARTGNRRDVTVCARFNKMCHGPQLQFRAHDPYSIGERSRTSHTKRIMMAFECDAADPNITQTCPPSNPAPWQASHFSPPQLSGTTTATDFPPEFHETAQWDDDNPGHNIMPPTQHHCSSHPSVPPGSSGIHLPTPPGRQTRQASSYTTGAPDSKDNINRMTPAGCGC